MRQTGRAALPSNPIFATQRYGRTETRRRLQLPTFAHQHSSCPTPPLPLPPAPSHPSHLIPALGAGPRDEPVRQELAEGLAVELLNRLLLQLPRRQKLAEDALAGAQGEAAGPAGLSHTQPLHRTATTARTAHRTAPATPNTQPPPTARAARTCPISVWARVGVRPNLSKAMSNQS